MLFSFVLQLTRLWKRAILLRCSVWVRCAVRAHEPLCRKKSTTSSSRRVWSLLRNALWEIQPTQQPWMAHRYQRNYSYMITGTFHDCIAFKRITNLHCIKRKYPCAMILKVYGWLKLSIGNKNVKWESWYLREISWCFSMLLQILPLWISG